VFVHAFVDVRGERIVAGRMDIEKASAFQLLRLHPLLDLRSVADFVRIHKSWRVVDTDPSECDDRKRYALSDPQDLRNGR
jgi:hypothetical protein